MTSPYDPQYGQQPYGGQPNPGPRQQSRLGILATIGGMTAGPTTY